MHRAAHQRFDKNASGRDLIVGDIHGCYEKLRVALGAIGFDPERDRLFSVGDLTDRGPQSQQALEWLAYPWFHPVEGNHEQLARDYHAGLIPGDYFVRNGGAWLVGMTPAERTPFIDAFNSLPTAITLDTGNGLVGIVHANCPLPSWGELLHALESEAPLPADQPGQIFAASMRNICVWDRSRIESGKTTPIAGVRAVVCGHTIVPQPQVRGNVLFIDTGACTPNGQFTILDAATLCQAESAALVAE